MEAPKCKLCGTRHYGPCFRITTASEGAAVTVQIEGGSLQLKAGETLTLNERGEPKITKKFDRNAYQREYMRKRRAALREKADPV